MLDVENPGASRPDPSHIADKVAYTGIAVYSPEILGFLPAGVSHATVAWVAASKPGTRSGRWTSPAPTGTTSAPRHLRARCARRAAGERRDGLRVAGRPVRKGRDRRLRRARVRKPDPGRRAHQELHPHAGRRRDGRSRELDRRTRLRDFALRSRHAAVDPRRRQEARVAERSALRAALQDAARRRTRPDAARHPRGRTRFSSDSADRTALLSASATTAGRRF